MKPKQRRELAAVLGFAAVSALFLVGKPFHMDEPLFLAPARHIVSDPLRPFDFEFNWYGRAVPMSSINNTPPLMLYALAAAWKLTGGLEVPMRALFVPVNLLAAASLYLLAAEFLAEPLWPVLILIASPAYLINMNLLYPETLALALGFLGLWLLVRSNGKRRDLLLAGAGLCGAAIFAKYGAVFLIPTAAYYLWKKRTTMAGIAAFAGIAVTPICAYILYDRLTYHAAVGSAWTALSQSVDMPYQRWSHRLRAILCFTGGSAPVVAVWPWLGLELSSGMLMTAAGAAVLLMLPAFDLASVRLIDRAAGLALAFGALAAYAGVMAGRRMKGWDLWAPWILSVLAVQAFLYWSVLARLILFLLPPLVFALAEGLEARLSRGRREALYAASFAATLLLSAGLAFVDGRYAAVQRDVARDVAARYPGRRLWCAGHWGLQYYLEQAGARELDYQKGDWDEVRPGDVVVVPTANSNVLRPRGKLLANVRTVTVAEPLPLRLISAFGGEAGFYSSATGFLPFSLGTEPLDRFDVVEVLP